MATEGDIDRVLLSDFFPSDSRAGVMVEVGAADPEYLSIGQAFRRRGWLVLSIEPNPVFCDAHRKLGNEVLQFACSDEDKDDETFFVVESKGAKYEGGDVTFESFSSLGMTEQFADLHASANVESETTPIPVKVRRLNSLMAEFAPAVQSVDLLAIDVEGWELKVLDGFDIHRYRPKVVVLENNFDDEAYRTRMRTLGYSVARTIAPNEIYVRSIHEA